MGMGKVIAGQQWVGVRLLQGNNNLVGLQWVGVRLLQDSNGYG